MNLPFSQWAWIGVYLWWVKASKSVTPENPNSRMNCQSAYGWLIRRGEWIFSLPRSSLVPAGYILPSSKKRRHCPEVLVGSPSENSICDHLDFHGRRAAEWGRTWSGRPDGT